MFGASIFTKKLLITIVGIAVLALFSIAVLSNQAWAEGLPSLTPREEGDTSFWDKKDASKDKSNSGLLQPRGEDGESYWDDESEHEENKYKERPERRLMLEEAGRRGKTPGSRDSEIELRGLGSGSGATMAGTTVVNDVTPPMIMNIGTEYGHIIVTWTTDEPATSRVNYGEAGGDLNLASSSAAFVTNHSIYLGVLENCTSYNFEVVSTDESGNTATSTKEGTMLSSGCVGGGGVG